MREHDIALQCGKIVLADAGAGELSEAGVDPIDRLALGDDRLDRGRRRLDLRAAGEIERNLRPFENVAPSGERHRARGQPRFGRHTPLQMRACNGLKPSR